ncbi:MAG: outer membrane lipoprotein-sorting protein [Pseudomonadota bacterium]
MRTSAFFLTCILLWLAGPAGARQVLPYPEGAALTADQLAAQVFAAAHGGLVENALSKRNKADVSLVVNRAPLSKRGNGRKPIVQTFDTFLNHNPEDPALVSLQMAILTSGKAKGTGLLFTDYADEARGATITMWLPALRKIRLINQPSYEDVWFGTNLTYGEIVLRKPEDETHELLEDSIFNDCLDAMKLEKWEKTRYTKKLPGPQCGHKGKPVYRLKSTTRFKDWWYDYHVSDIDKRTFSVYRTVYFKDGEKIKTVVVDWQSLEQPDPRITYPRYIYAITHTDGRDSMVYVPRSTIELNADLPDSFWSAETLKTHTR